MSIDKRHEHGPFDIIGDIHGCFDELTRLLEKLGYCSTTSGFAHPEGRKAVFLGDLVDRGHGVVGVLRVVMEMVAAGHALCVSGNHEVKLGKKLRRPAEKVSFGLPQSLEQIAREAPAFASEVADFIGALPAHCVLDGGRLVVAHAGLAEAMHGRDSGRARELAVYGETTGETTASGRPIRRDWAADYRGAAMVVYGHTPVLVPAWSNNTICIDTGCVYGGALTALRYPERKLVSVTAAHTYCERNPD